MKNKTINSVLLLVLIPVLYFLFVSGIANEEKTVSPALNPPSQSSPKDFINCILNDGYDPNRIPGYLMENNFSMYKEINFNAVHRYFGSDTIYGEFRETLDSTEIRNTSKLYDSLAIKDMKAVFGTVNIQNLCNGQRLEYESEDGNNGFSYQWQSAPGEPDSGRTVLHACTNEIECPETADATPRWLCHSIYENLQHTDGFTDFVVPGDRNGNWFLKPEMRIDSSVVDNNPTLPVIRIDVVNFRGDVIKSDTIKARNFGRFDVSSGT